MEGERGMRKKLIDLPAIICLEDFAGNYSIYIDKVYELFKRDLIDNRPKFGSSKLAMKFNPLFQDRAYTFYHMTHTGEIEKDRLPDLRRCERVEWAKITIENVEKWDLKFWRQERNGKKNRICIQLSVEDDVDYYVILDVRREYILLWTAFIAELEHAKRKKEEEYKKWVLETNGKYYTPDSLVEEIRKEMTKKQEPIQ